MFREAMMKSLVCLFFIFLLLSIPLGAQSPQRSPQERTTRTWTGLVSYDWNTANNWNPVGIPAWYDSAVIPTGLFLYPLLVTDIGVCYNLTLETGARITLGDWILGSAPIHVYGNALMGGELRIYESSIFRVDGDITWQNGSTVDITNENAIIYCFGNMTFASGSNIDFFPATVEFLGDDSSVITNHSSYTRFRDLQVYNMYPASLTVSAASTQPFMIRGNLWLANSKLMNIEYGGNIYLVGNLQCSNNTSGGLHCTAGTLVMFGYDQNISFSRT